MPATSHYRSRSAGRPRRFDPDCALDAALELFWRNGYRSTTTRDLEAKLGLSQSSLYNAFGSKQNLLSAALDRYEHRIDEELLQPLETSAGGLDAIDAFFVSLAHWVTHEGRRGCMLINLMAEDGGGSEAIVARTRGYRKRVRRAFRNAVARAARAGETTGDAIDARADLLMGMVLGINIAARGGAPASELRRFLGGVRNEIARWRASSS